MSLPNDDLDVFGRRHPTLCLFDLRFVNIHYQIISVKRLAEKLTVCIAATRHVDQLQLVTVANSKVAQEFNLKAL